MRDFQTARATWEMAWKWCWMTKISRRLCKSSTECASQGLSGHQCICFERLVWEQQVKSAWANVHRYAKSSSFFTSRAEYSSVCSVWLRRLPRERNKGYYHPCSWLAAATRGDSCSAVDNYLFSCTSFGYLNRRGNLVYLHSVLEKVRRIGLLFKSTNVH